MKNTAALSSNNRSSDTNITLVVLCKRPRVGHGKQRLAATIGTDNAYQIARHLLDCAIEDASHWPGPVVLSPADEKDVAWLQALMPDARVIPQSEGNLGQRIMALDQVLYDTSHQPRVYIGTDAPILANRYFQQSISALDDHEVVFSHAADGGVTLMGVTDLWPDITDLAWSTPALSQQLRLRCEQAGIKVTYIDPSYDVDIEKDLFQLMTDLKKDNRPARKQLLACVEALKIFNESVLCMTK